MNEDDKKKTFLGISRRQFLGASAAAAGGVIRGRPIVPTGTEGSWDSQGMG